jgi:hypothetical protein
MLPSDFNEITLIWAVVAIGFIILCIALWKRIVPFFYISTIAFALCGLYIIFLPDNTLINNIIGSLLIFVAITDGFLPLMTQGSDNQKEEPNPKTYMDHYADKLEATRKARNRFRSPRRNVW